MSNSISMFILIYPLIKHPFHKGLPIAIQISFEWCFCYNSGLLHPISLMYCFLRSDFEPSKLSVEWDPCSPVANVTNKLTPTYQHNSYLIHIDHGWSVFGPVFMYLSHYGFNVSSRHTWATIHSTLLGDAYIDGLLQESHNSSALAMELCISCINLSICVIE